MITPFYPINAKLKRWTRASKLIEVVSGTGPDRLRVVSVEFKTICQQPVTNIRNAFYSRILHQSKGTKGEEILPEQ